MRRQKTMNRPVSKWSRVRLSIALACAAALPGATSAFAQTAAMMQLDVIAPEYTLRGFKYKAPATDGWRQMANVTGSLSIVYVVQPDPEKIETIFGVAMEAHEIPADVQVEGAAALAVTSANQMAEARKADLVGRSPVEAVPSIENLYTYRLMVRSPVAGQPDGYEIYYVMLSPDKKQYLVAQCIAKNQDYSNQVYFQEFYGSLASIRYVGSEGAPATPPAASSAPKADAPQADAPKAETPPAAPAAEPHVHDPNVPHTH
jgi:hypothetical protein